jgi:uncharacterized hydrophobic protein (TIGR00271 family)
MTEKLRSASRLQLAARPLRNAFARAFGLSPSSREACIRAMLERHRRDSFGHWFQLLVAMGLATLGLVLDSTAVVIGAMLISPLMSPIVELGMGLATGSAVLLLRALARTALSILGVVGAAALLARALPFDQITAEINARAAPTVLDLFVAALCALMAAYTTMRTSSDTTATAAGAAIGIALVPPLCVVGWGLGTGHFDLAQGAALLFTANFCAILALTALVFFSTGFDDLDIGALERETAKQSRFTDRAAHRLRNLLGSAYGVSFRVGLPVLLASAVIVPLHRALKQVEWEVRVRTSVEQLVAELAPKSESVQSRVDVRAGAVSVRLVLVTTTANAGRIRSELHRRIRAVSGVVPSVDVTAVADVRSMQALAKTLDQEKTRKPNPVSLLALETFDEALKMNWPGSGTGTLIGWSVERSVGAPILTVTHFAPALGAGGLELLGRITRSSTNEEVRVREHVVPNERVEGNASDGTKWLLQVTQLLAQTSDFSDKLFFCVEAPAEEKESTSITLQSLSAAMAGIPSDRRTLTFGERWSAKISNSPCANADDDGSAGAGSAAPTLPDAGDGAGSRAAEQP